MKMKLKRNGTLVEVTLTAEQEAICEAALSRSESLIVNAMAGCAKTSTLEMLASTLPVQPSLALAFNKKIKLEMEARFPGHFEVKTMNGLGHGAWMKTIGKRLTLDEKKMGNLLKNFLDKEKFDLPRDEFGNVLQLVRKARAAGLVTDAVLRFKPKAILPDTPEAWQNVADSIMLDLTEEHIYVARSVLTQSVFSAYQGLVDFDDQIYMSALFGGQFPRFPLVVVDEAQDLSPLNHLQVKLVAADRLAVCGDPRQAIYAFRGADSRSMGALQSLRKDWLEFPLSLTFRCPAAVVDRQQRHAPGFTAADAAPKGQVLNWTEEEWSIQKVDEQTPVGAQVAIICRNNAPVIAAALRIIRKGIGVTVLGGEIGKSLVALVKKIVPKTANLEESAEAIKLWLDKEATLARVNGKEDRIPLLEDKAQCLLAVLADLELQVHPDAAPAAAQLIGKFDQMFASSSTRFILCTGHKSKGLEWHTVIHLDPWRLPSKWARAAQVAGNPVPMEQELNLQYVIETRTQDTLILANLEQMK